MLGQVENRIDIRKLLIEEAGDRLFDIDVLIDNTWPRLVQYLRQEQSVPTQANVLPVATDCALLRPDLLESLGINTRSTMAVSVSGREINRDPYAVSLDKLLQAKILFPDNPELLDINGFWHTLRSAVDANFGGNDRIQVSLFEARRLAAFKIVNPEEFGQLKYLDGYWKGMSEYVKAYMAPGKEGVSLGAFAYAAYARILYPERFSEIFIPYHVNSEAQKAIKIFSRQNDLSSFAYHALHYKIVTAKNVQVVDWGLEITMPGKQIDNPEVVLPAVRKF